MVAGTRGESQRSSWATGAWEKVSWDGDSWHGHGQGQKDRPSERLSVPEFEGNGAGETEIGQGARSYVRKVQVWLRCTKLPPEQRALALYNGLSGRAWLYGEELDVDKLASPEGVQYYLDWIQARFMEVEMSKITQVMGDLFKRCRRGHEQSVRDFVVEYERLVLRLMEVKCELPCLVKAWLFVDRLRLSEAEEVALLASVGNQWDCRQLQQAALVHDRSGCKSHPAETRSGGGAAAGATGSRST